MADQFAWAPVSPDGEIMHFVGLFKTLREAEGRKASSHGHFAWPKNWKIKRIKLIVEETDNADKA